MSKEDFNIDSFKDEDLLNLINVSIIENSEFSINDMTGAYIQMTMSSNKKYINTKVYMLFGYKNRNSQQMSIEIEEQFIYVWLRAIELKMKSLQVRNTGVGFNEMYRLMNSSYEDRTMTHCTSTPTNTNLPTTNIYKNLEILNWKDMKSFVIGNRLGNDDKQLVFQFENKEVSISDKEIPYFRKSSRNLSFAESDRFYKYLFENLEETIKVIEKG
jgi:hypothetical protein